MTSNRELEERLRLVAFFLKELDGDFAPHIEACKDAASRLREFDGAPVAYLLHNEDLGVDKLCLHPATSNARFDGWTQTPLYRHPQRLDALAQFGPGQRSKVRL